MVFQILRPDDLAALEIEAGNLRLDTSDAKKPKLVVADAKSPAYLIVNFQPQSIVEKAYFEVSANNPQNPAGTPPSVPQPPTTATPIDPPGSVPARMAGGSRLVFRLPKGMKEIAYTNQALLDWSKLELIVSPAALGQPKLPPLLPPTAMQTAVELPYRLILSPGEYAGWINATLPETFAGRTALWHTRLAKAIVVKTKTGTERKLQEASESNKLPLRAVWSPDFVDHGPLPPVTDDAPFLATMSARDRAQIVILTSGVTGYSTLNDGGAIVPFVPTPIAASKLFLSTLGAWLDSRGSWPTLPFYTLASRSPATGVPPPQALDLTEWAHVATQGRDHYVRIVYQGFLYPFGHRASLIKVTERKVLPPENTASNSPTAYLMQRMYIVVREKEKTYGGEPYQYNRREMPLWKTIAIKTLVTPDIDPPAYFDAQSNSFWIRVASADFPFHLVGTDLAGKKIDFLASLIFMGDSEPNAATVTTQYATSGDRRLCQMKGQKLTYADPSAGDTALKTNGLVFNTQPLQAGPPYLNAPFLPYLEQAEVTVPALEQLLGTTTPVPIQLYSGYLKNGLDNKAGVFADLAPGAVPPALQFSASQSGGFSTPNLSLTAISARKGVVAGKSSDAAAGVINPKEFFDITAQLFGVIPLTGLIPVDKGTGLADATQNAPEIRTVVLPSLKHAAQVVTKIEWAPQLTDYAIGPLTINFHQNGPSKLTLKARIARDLKGGPPNSQVKGELTNFLITLLDVIALQVESIKFSSESGQKQIVKAKLPSDNPIEFTGPLSFVQTLASILPPGIFGSNGPSIKIEPTQLRVAYTLGLPTVSVGVFSLENISFMAGMDLPYLDGKPAFEFGFASRSKPFLLTVECIGGGGFIHLIVDTSGVQMVEGALEFGGEFSFDVGVASGGVHIMAGIYFQLKATSSDISGFVDIGGEVSILGIISISIDLNLSLSYETSNGKSMVQGRATLSVSIHIIFFSISVSVSVEKSFGSTSGDPRVKQVISKDDWAEYAAAFA